MVYHRPRVIIGNWKMHKTVEEAIAFVRNFLSAYQANKKEKIGLAVPYTAIQSLTKELGEKTTSLMIGAQNMNDCSEGAFTGEIAGRMLTEAGAQFVLLGHSERRRYFGENDALINRKIKKAVDSGLHPVLCVGETETEHNDGQTEKIIEKQLTDGLKGISPVQLKNLMIAYEPVWAIGTGKNATPEEAQSVHCFCRQILSGLLTEEIALTIVILYGGSVLSSNAESLLKQPDIDGLLIGGASLSLESFLQIVNDDSSKLEK